jgi:uncharacterized protein involved in exopolysaccharide biosynthesis
MDNKTDDAIIISFKDLKKIIFQNRKIILVSTIITSCLAIFYAITRPIEYIAEGTFRDKAKTGNGMPTFAGLLSGSSLNDNNAIALMNSRTMRENLSKALSLQADVKHDIITFNRLKTIWQNIQAETNRYFHPHFLSLKDKNTLLSASDVTYHGEVPKTLRIVFLTDEQFEILDQKKQTFGKLYEKVTVDDYSFILKPLTHTSLKGEKFNISILPLYLTAKSISDNLTIEQDRMDKNLLNIKFKNPDRHLSAKAVNHLMNIYKDYLRQEQNIIIHNQIQYLEKRQDEISNRLKTSMENHVLKISDDIKNIGFPNTNLAMEFLTESQNSLQKKLLDIEFELKRLHISQEAGYAYYDTYMLPGDPAIINEMLTAMRDLKQQSDWLNLSLQDSKTAPADELELQLTEQLKSLKTNRDYRVEAKHILHNLEDLTSGKTHYTIADDEQYLVKPWFLKIQESIKSHGAHAEETKACTSQFCSYLKHLIHHFDVHESAIQERMVHSQMESKDFKGIDLKASQGLFISYANKLNEIESQVLQNQFILDEMNKEDFELSSLSTILNDHISLDMSTKATLLALNLKDSNNRTSREQERIKEDLDLQKRFLTTHLKNSNQLLRLNEGLMKYKVKSLQSVTLGLVQQQISLLENNLSEYIVSRIKNLKAESEIIEQHKTSLMDQMSALPSKWVSEKLINLQIEMNQKMVEEISKLVETKNISNNLEIIQSTVIDSAIAPIHPKPAKIFFFAILGSMIGLLLSSSFVILRDFKTNKN